MGGKMNKMIKIFFIVLVATILSGCKRFMKKTVSSPVFPASRATLYGDVPKEKRLLLGFGDRISHEAQFGPNYRGNDVKDYLESGMNPNYCLKMYDGWQYRNPLMLFCADFLNKSYYEKNHLIQNYETEVFDQLIKAGADINKYPYIWAQIYLWNNTEITIFEKNYHETKENVEKFIPLYVSDCNRVLRMFLNAEADVNRKGSPIPFDEEKCKRMTEEKIQEYFNIPEATTPLYEAIKKGILWESQVDLLLEYGAKLDESCLEAAKLSGDAKMISKIEELLKKKK